MLDFIMCVIQYVLIAFGLAGIAGLGIFFGAKASEAKKAKKAAAATTEE